MSVDINDSLASLLPQLRRFARALTGSQEKGDEYVIATVEALLVDASLLRQDLPIKVGLFQSFIRIWDAMPLNRRHDSVEPSAENIADRRIETLTPLARQAFLLVALEDFSRSDLAAILSVSELKAAELVDAASKEVSDQIATRVLIVEDEPLIALDIETLVSEIGHKVVGIARTRARAVQLAREARPGLVLADIHLADGSSGIEAVNEILGHIDVPVIFITAFPERLLTGERPEPAFLITKPFRTDMVKAVISQALFFDLRAGRKAA